MVFLERLVANIYWLLHKLYLFFWMVLNQYHRVFLMYRFPDFRNISVEKRGSGGMYKYIFTTKTGEKFFIKKADWLHQLWTVVNLKLPMGRQIPSYQNFSDVADVLEYILGISVLSQHTLLKKVDRRNKEIWQQYLEGDDIEHCRDNVIVEKLDDLVRLFGTYGLVSIDHNGKNAMVSGQGIYLIDIESFEFSSSIVKRSGKVQH